MRSWEAGRGAQVGTGTGGTLDAVGGGTPGDAGLERRKSAGFSVLSFSLPTYSPFYSPRPLSLVWSPVTVLMLQPMISDLSRTLYIFLSVP